MLVKVKSDSQTQNYSQVRRKFTTMSLAVGGEICGTVTVPVWNQQILLCMCVFRVVQ